MLSEVELNAHQVRKQQSGDPEQELQLKFLKGSFT